MGLGKMWWLQRTKILAHWYQENVPGSPNKEQQNTLLRYQGLWPSIWGVLSDIINHHKIWDRIK